MALSAPLWYLITPLILFVILIPGGFFMFRAFLRRMAPENEPKQENQS
ncbi:MAG TPA: hypothetical protein VFV52_06905 [Bacilli bacterium]|nr:hypothetical protein [Bacilli bacterium]